MVGCVATPLFQFDITKEAVVVVVVSTTGDGEAPDTVSKYASLTGLALYLCKKFNPCQLSCIGSLVAEHSV